MTPDEALAAGRISVEEHAFHTDPARVIDADGHNSLTSAPAARAPSRGDVYQINEAHGRKGWIGAFVLVTEVKSWGIQGFVHHIDTHDQNSSVFIRLKYEEIDFIGHAVLVPAELGTCPHGYTYADLADGTTSCQDCEPGKT